MATIRIDHIEEAFWAARTGDEEALRSKLDAWGQGVEVRDNQGRTLLAHVVAQGHVGCAKLLLDKGCDIDAKDDDMLTALMIACGGGLRDSRREAGVDLVRMLLAAGAGLEVSGKNGETSLMIASRSGCLEFVDELLAAGADADTSDDDGYTALMYACDTGSQPCVARLIEAGCDVGKVNRGGGTALRMAQVNSFAMDNSNYRACVGALEAECERRELLASMEGESVKKPSLRM